MSIDKTTPEEGMFTVHFKNVGRGKATFDAQVTDLEVNTLRRAMRTQAIVLPSLIWFGSQNLSSETNIYAGPLIVGSFTITPPTLKGDPDEPT